MTDPPHQEHPRLRLDDVPGETGDLPELSAIRYWRYVLYDKISNWRANRRFMKYVRQARGPTMHRVAVAVAMRLMEDSLVRRLRKDFRPDELPVFVSAYQCFVVWVIEEALKDRLEPADLEDIRQQIRETFARFSSHTPALFDEIWPRTREFMPSVFEEGYPLPGIAQAATLAGHPLPHTRRIYDHDLNVELLVLLHQSKVALDGCPATDVPPQPQNPGGPAPGR